MSYRVQTSSTQPPALLIWSLTHQRALYSGAWVEVMVQGRRDFLHTDRW